MAKGMIWRDNFLESRDAVPQIPLHPIQAVRPRSLYTAHSYLAEEVPNDYGQYESAAEPWQARGRLLRPLRRAGRFWPLPPKVAMAAAAGRMAAHMDREMRPELEYEAGGEDAEETGPMATSMGTITLRLYDRVRVDLSLNGSVRVINFKSNIVLAISATGTSVALMHPNGRVYQYGSRVEIRTNDTEGNCKYAKMWYKGVSFTSDSCALVYLVDAAGTRSTTDTFSDLNRDFSLDVFYSESRYGPDCVHECLAAIDEARFWVAEDGSEVWDVAGVRITQQLNGQVKLVVQRDNGKRLLRTSSTLGTANITTPFIHTTASMGQNPHIFVRRGERRLHYDATNFVVRNAGHSAGFDDRGRLKVY
ncbi:uncharacterized protein LOC119106233 [Pollicipes pollicipes]|uniref:uncharacterized protein LOC119106233 n=1 Tax=Pollicipes pollicipes TaxID=41117 RepID=UPI00188552B8|nr:uncharacterized protein LOC119106233 [Pollicipes pollicipes]